MMALISNWRYVLHILNSLALVVFVGLWRIEVAETKSLKAEITRMDEQIEIATLEINQCSKDKALTEKVSNDYQKSIANLRNQLNGLRDNPTCIPTEPSGAGSGNNGATSGGVVPSGIGLKTGYLFDYAGRAEETRLKLIGCQSFINELYKSRGYND